MRFLKPIIIITNKNDIITISFYGLIKIVWTVSIKRQDLSFNGLIKVALAITFIIVYDSYNKTTRIEANVYVLFLEF